MITSLHSPHVEAVKALLGSRGVKARRESHTYVVESLQNIRELIDNAPLQIKTLYATADGLEKLGAVSSVDVQIDIQEVSPEVMKAMTDTVTPQGLLAIAKIPNNSLDEFFAMKKDGMKLAYFWEIQDPGNAGTVIRAADAFGFDGVLFSDKSVDVYSPKVVRSSAGSHWHIPIFEDVTIEALLDSARNNSFELYATDADANLDLLAAAQESSSSSAIWIFGNEARGIPNQLQAKRVAIPINGKAESLNLATAASVVMYAASAARK
jgi:TrmH family RNA methyltransferase